jgi:hypothetical protein
MSKGRCDMYEKTYVYNLYFTNNKEVDQKEFLSRIESVFGGEVTVDRGVGVWLGITLSGRRNGETALVFCVPIQRHSPSG